MSSDSFWSLRLFAFFVSSGFDQQCSADAYKAERVECSYGRVGRDRCGNPRVHPNIVHMLWYLNLSSTSFIILLRLDVFKARPLGMVCNQILLEKKVMRNEDITNIQQWALKDELRIRLCKEIAALWDGNFLLQWQQSKSKQCVSLMTISVITSTVLFAFAFSSINSTIFACMVGEAALEIRAPEHVGEVEHDQVAIKSELRPSSSRSLSVAQPQMDPDYLDLIHVSCLAHSSIIPTFPTIWTQKNLRVQFGQLSSEDCQKSPHKNSQEPNQEFA